MQQNQFPFENFVAIFRSLMGKQNSQTEYNHQMFMQFKEQDPENFIRYLCQIIMNDQYYTELGLPAIVVLRKSMGESQNKASVFTLLPSEEQNAYLNSILNRIDQLSFYNKPINDCAILIIRDFVMMKKEQTAIKPVIDFIDKVINQSSENIIKMQQIGQILQNISELEPAILIQIITIDDLLEKINVLLSNEKLHLFYIQSLINIILGFDQYEQQFNINNFISKQQKDTIMDAIFSCIMKTTNQQMLEKFMQKFVKMTELFEVMDLLSNYYDSFLQVLEYVFSINKSDAIYISVLQILSNLLYAGGQIDVYSPNQINATKLFYVRHIFTYIEENIDLNQQNQAFLVSDYGIDLFDQNSIESAFVEFCSQVYCQLLESIYDVIEAFITQPANNPQGRLYTIIWIIISMLKSDQYYQKHIYNVVLYLIQNVNNIQNNLQINQYLIIHALQEVINYHGKNKEVVKLIINYKVDDLIISMVNQIQATQNNSQVFQELLVFMKVIFKTQRYKQFDVMTQFLYQLPQLLQTRWLPLSSTVLRTMGFIVRKNDFINHGVIQSYLVYFTQSCQYVIISSSQLNIQTQLSMIDHYSSHLKFISKVLIAFHADPSLDHQLIQQTITSVTDLFKNKDIALIHGLTPNIIKFVFYLLPVFPAYFKTNLEAIYSAYIDIIQQDIYSKPNLFDAAIEDSYNSHITKWQQNVYKSLGTMFLNYPEYFNQNVVNLINLLDNKKDMGIFTKVDQISCIYSSLNCFTGQQLLIQFQNQIDRITKDLVLVQCSCTFANYIKQFDIVIELMYTKCHQDPNIAQYCQQIVERLYSILMEVLKKNNSVFQKYLSEQKQEYYELEEGDDSTPIDNERNEFANVHDIVQQHLIKILTLQWPDPNVQQILKEKLNNQLGQDVDEFGKTLQQIKVTIINVIFATCPEIDDNQRINMIRFMFKQFMKDPNVMLYRHEIIFILQNIIQYTEQLLSEQVGKYIFSLDALFQKEQSENIVYLNLCKYIFHFEIFKKTKFKKVELANQIDTINNRIIVSMQQKYMGQYMLKQMQFASQLKDLQVQDSSNINTQIKCLSWFEKLFVIMINNCEKQYIISHLDYVKQQIINGQVDITKIQKLSILSNNGLEVMAIICAQE